MTKIIETLFVFDRETCFISASSDSKKIKVISSKSDLQELSKSKFSIKNVIILVELDWDVPISSFYGYEIAKQLITDSIKDEKKFNLLFVSMFSREALLGIYQGQNSIFIRKFSHKKIDADIDLFKLKVPEYSEAKFKYLGNYCLSEAGILDRLAHDVENLRNSFNQQKFKNLIGDLNANKVLFTNELTRKIDSIRLNMEPSERNTLLTEVCRLLEEHQRKIRNHYEGDREKSSARILLVEDNQETLKKLEKIFSHFFTNIKSYFKGCEAFTFLEKKTNATKIDVVLTDLELLIEDNFDDEKQGIDILELCEAEYPHIVKRAITALPKRAVRDLLNMPISHFIYKGGEGETVIHPIENLPGFVDNINKELRMMQSMLGPKGSWWKHLTKRLYQTKKDNFEEFNRIWKDAKDQATRFIKGKFDNVPDKEKLSAKFAHSQRPDKAWETKELLLTHRLIALWFSSKSQGDFPYSEYKNQAGFQEPKLKRTSQAYFNTFLGLSVEGASKLQSEHVSCRILLTDLFPEEWDWLVENKEDNIDNPVLFNLNSYFQEMLEKFWVIYKKVKINENMTVKATNEHLIQFIQDFSIDEQLLAELRKVFISYIDKWDNNWDDDEWESSYPQLKAYIDKMKEILRIPC